MSRFGWVVSAAEAVARARGVSRVAGWGLSRAASRGLLPVPPVDPRVGDVLPDWSASRDRVRDDPFTWRASEARDAGDGPLAGWTFAVKDNFEVAGSPMHEGTCIVQAPSLADAAMVRRLEQRGARLVGKTHMTELGLSGLGVQIHHGTLDNPAAPGHLAGGSSTGPAVAVAGGHARFAIGSDAAGSIRIPSSFCGLFGLKPTHGTIDCGGYRTVAPDIDMPGPLTRTLADLEHVFDALVDAPSMFAPAVAAPRVLTPARALPASAEVGAALERAARILAAAGCEAPDYKAAARCVMLSGMHWLKDMSCPPRPTNESRLVFAFSTLIEAEVLASMADIRRRMRNEVLRLLDTGDAHALLMPTTAIAAPAMTDARLSGAFEPALHGAIGAYTPLANVTGLPSLAVPFGRDARGRPLSVMLIGRPYGERTLFALARRLTAA